jgi:glyoxylase-like metal-dependent hydrolase (beta-lactamase superfamily II)
VQAAAKLKQRSLHCKRLDRSARTWGLGKTGRSADSGHSANPDAPQISHLQTCIPPSANLQRARRLPPAPRDGMIGSIETRGIMTRWPFRKGLHDLGNGCFAYLQPNGSWGWSNAGLITDSGEALLVDTLYDLKLTREMLETMRASVPAAADIGVLVNTHSNADHTFGNQLVAGAQIIASTKCYEEMRQVDVDARREELRNWQAHGDAGRFQHENLFGKFDFDGVALTLPTRTFDRALDLTVGTKQVQLVEVGPAHTRGDILIHVPADRTVFTGDIVFSNGHPPAWAGPISNWIKACDLIMSWDVDVVVPGHGPIVEKSALKDFKAYFEYITRETRKRYDAGMSVVEAAFDIDLKPFDGWLDPERIVVNVNTLYRDFGATHGLTATELRGWMCKFRDRHRADGAHDHSGPHAH